MLQFLRPKFLKKLAYPKQARRETLEPNTLAHEIVDAAADKKAANILMLDMRQVTLLADYFIICEGASVRQIKAIVEGVRESLRELKIFPLHVEGTADAGWVLLDYSDVILHVFSPEVRSYYNLEELWREAPVVVRML